MRPIKVIDNGQLIGTTTVTPDGTWALTPTTPLADGPHSITATATDPAGNTSPQTAAIPFTVDTSAVVEPVITRALDDVAPQTGVVASGGATNDKHPTLEGTARAGDRVELFYKVPGGANVSIGFTTADANGQWSLTPAAALTERSYDFVARGDRRDRQPQQPEQHLQPADRRDRAGRTRHHHRHRRRGQPNKAPWPVAPPPTTPRRRSWAPARPGDTIRVLDGSTVLGTTTVKADGSWSLTPTTTLSDGLHNFRAIEVDAAGNESLPSNIYGVIIDTQAPARPTITGVTDDVGAIQGNVASGGTTDDVLPGIKGKAEAGATVNVFDGARLIGTTTADANGDWTLAVTVALASGAHNFTATATDAAGNPSGASDPYGITVDTALVIVVNPGSATATSEEGLAGGVKDATGTPADTTDATSAAGTLSASGPGGAATSWTLTAPTTILTAGGVAVTWTGSGTQTLTGSAGGVQVATLSINNSGAYSFNLLAPIDHPVKNAEDVLTLNFGVNAGNGTSTGTGTLALTVEDDAPSAVVPQTRDAALLDTNLLITLDISGSMNTADGIGGQTRLQSAIQSINTLLDKYDGFGDVRVRLVTFSTNANAVGTVWTDVATAKAQLAALAAGGGTNYDEGLGDAITAFGSAGKLSGGQNVSYFFSDGAPTFGSGTTAQLTPPGQSPGTPPTNGTGFDQSGADVGIQSAEETAWINFLNANQIKSFAIGFGAGAPTTTYLNPIAYDGQQGANTNGLVVTNFAQLDSALATTVTNNITGNLLGGDLISATGGLGGDAPGYVLSLTVEGTTYTYSPAAGGSVTAAGGANRGVFDTATDSLTITTAAGGRFIVDMDGGEYRYESPTSVTTAIAETFNYTLDGSGWRHGRLVGDGQREPGHGHGRAPAAPTPWQALPHPTSSWAWPATTTSAATPATTSCLGQRHRLPAGRGGQRHPVRRRRQRHAGRWRRGRPADGRCRHRCTDRRRRSRRVRLELWRRRHRRGAPGGHHHRLQCGGGQRQRRRAGPAGPADRRTQGRGQRHQPERHGRQPAELPGLQRRRRQHRNPRQFRRASLPAALTPQAAKTSASCCKAWTSAARSAWPPTANDAQIIQELLNRGKLIADGP